MKKVKVFYSLAVLSLAAYIAVMPCEVKGQEKNIKLVMQEVSLGPFNNPVNVMIIQNGRLVTGRQTKGIITETLTCSPDCKSVAFTEKRDKKMFVVVDGVEGKEYDETGTPIFSPDSKLVAYGAKRADKWFVVVNGVEGKEYEMIGIPIFSSDNKQVAYLAKRDDKTHIVVDGVEKKEYDAAGNLIFSPDSKRVACMAKRDDKWFIVVDGVEGQKEADLVRGSKLIFDSSNRLHGLTSHSNEFIRVDVDIMEE